ncbi:MAG: hypothetical protein ACRDL7_09855, partial [Gaiellaceae bacterium]
LEHQPDVVRVVRAAAEAEDAGYPAHGQTGLEAFVMVLLLEWTRATRRASGRVPMRTVSSST